MTETKMPDWEVVLNTMNPNYNGRPGRPRRMSMHTLAACTGRDIQELIKEVKESKKVVGYKCPDVGGACIFYLTSLRSIPGMIDSADRKDPERVWRELDEFLKTHPYPSVKGFKRFAEGYWTGGSYGQGKFVKGEYAMPTPFEAEDYALARAIRQSLLENGFTPGKDLMDIPDQDPPKPVAGCTTGCN